MSAISIHILLYKHTRNYPLIVGALVLLGLATARPCVDTHRIFAGFLHMARPERIDYLGSVTTGSYAARIGLYASMVAVGDSFVVSRSDVYATQ